MSAPTRLPRPRPPRTADVGLLRAWAAGINSRLDELERELERERGARRCLEQQLKRLVDILSEFATDSRYAYEAGTSDDRCYARFDVEVALRHFRDDLFGDTRRAA